MVPRSIQADVWKHYRAGQCDDMNPSKDWHATADAAIGFVAMKEGKAIRNVEALELMARGFRTKALDEAAATAQITAYNFKWELPPFVGPGVPEGLKAFQEAWDADPKPATGLALVGKKTLRTIQELPIIDKSGELLAKAPTTAASNFVPMVVGQRPPPAGRMTFADAMAAGAMCNICPLAKYKLAPLMVPPLPLNSPEFIVVGEGPGRVEIAHGKPFIGPTGQFLTSLLKEAGVDRTKGHITNVALCMGDSDKEKQRAAECCTPRLLKELSAISPDVPILSLGKHALKATLGKVNLFMAKGSARGFFWRLPEIAETVVNAARRKAEKNPHPELVRKALTLSGRAALANRVLLPTLHPAFVMRADTWKPILQVDIKRFGRVVRGELTEALLADGTRPYKVYAKPENIRRMLAKMKSEVAIDIETDGVDPTKARILCVGISDGKRTLVIGPWDPQHHAKVLTDGISNRRSIYHNGVCFDVIALRKDGVVINNELIDDTLIAHHVIGSHFPQRLDHCVSVYGDARPWKVKYGRKGQEEKGLLPVDLPLDELYKYNNIDAVLTIDLWHALQTDLSRHIAIYDHDMKLAHLATQMIIDGIGVNVEHRELLRGKMKRKQDVLRRKMRRLVGDPTFQVTDAQIRKAFFGKFQVPIVSMTPTGMPSTASSTLEIYKGNGTKAGELAALVLNWRGVRDARRRYIERDALQISTNRYGHRVCVPWKIYGTPTGRWSGPLQSLPRPAFITRCRKCGAWEVTAQTCNVCRNAQSETKSEAKKPLLETRIREIYEPRTNCTFVYFDLNQAEANVGANVSGDPNFLETCKGDVHTGNACAIFPDRAEIIAADPKGAGKPFRDVAKNYMFGIVYGAAEDTIHKMLIAKGFNVQLREVKKQLELLHRKYRVYFSYAARNVAFVERNGYLISPFLFRKRFMSFHPKAEEVFNHVCQSGVADLMNSRLLEMMPQLPLSVRLVAQMHDACVFECPIGPDADAVEAVIKRTWEVPVTIPQSAVCAQERTFRMKIDLKRAQRLSDL